MKRSGDSPLGLYTIGIAALFLAGFLLLVIFGAQSYCKTVSGQYGNMDSRALNSYLATTLRGYDTKDAVSVADENGKQILIIRDGDTGYAVRLYISDGNLVEDFAKETASLKPEDAAVIGATDTFSIEMIKEDVMVIRTDEGKVIVNLRCEKGGAA
ncbi:MAG: DUF4860 domain-containing protein [Lachnospiraceae bacterium]|nr:DUF4860 domain-containing protein [Lachnospiraceae bacterium]